MSVKFNCEVSNSIWFNLTYQSNDILNKALNEKMHTEIKVLIAENIFNFCKKKTPIKQMDSHVHGNIIFSIDEKKINDIKILFNDIVSVLREPLVNYSPKLLFNLSIVCITRNDPWINYMYIEGSETINLGFQQQIKHLFTSEKETSKIEGIE